MDMKKPKGGKDKGHKDIGGGKMMCMKCNMEVTPKADGTCPGCGTMLKK
jgi:rubrerythrin